MKRPRSAASVWSSAIARVATRLGAGGMRTPGSRSPTSAASGLAGDAIAHGLPTLDGVVDDPGPRGPLVAPGTTTVEDVEWAFRILFAHDAERDNAVRLRLARPTLLGLFQHLTSSPAMQEPGRRERSGRQPLDATWVRWCYRLLRFETIDDEAAAAVAARHGTLSSLVDELLEPAAVARAVARVAPRPDRAVRLLSSKSMPRSGHHLLAQLLVEYYGSELRYCEFYGDGDACCHSIPCRLPFEPLLGNRLFMQKSHDVGFKDPVDVPGQYIVQYRHPIPRMQSNFDHNIHVTGRPDTWERFVSFAEAETAYFIRFWDRWIRTRKRTRDTCVVSYEDLVGQPRDTLQRVIHFIDGPDASDDAAMERALSVMRVPSGSSVERNHVAVRNAREYRHFDEVLYRSLEERVYAACPELDLPRLFS